MRPTRGVFPLLLVTIALSTACLEGSDGGDGTDTTDPTGETSSTDPETDDGPGDTDALDCDSSPVLDDEDPGSCRVQTLGCGDTLRGTTVGGSRSFDRTVWQSAQCLDYLLSDAATLGGPELVFGLDVPADRIATVTVESCARHDLRVVSTMRRCNTEANNCSVGSGSDRRSTVGGVVGTADGQSYEIIVDTYGDDDAEGFVFELSVSCR